MSDPIKSLLLDLNFQTALLESVDWDENRSHSLLQYLNETISKNSALPEDILDHIRREFGESPHMLIKQMFLDIYIENGLYAKSEGDYEH